jgi:hypothetical protein
MRAATLARLAIGGPCLVAPARVLDVVGGPDRHDPTVRLLARLLGGRWVLQGCGDLVLGRRSRVLGGVVDLTHAASMLPVIAGWSTHRRTATVSAAVASAIALLDVRAGAAGRWPGWVR